MLAFIKGVRQHNSLSLTSVMTSILVFCEQEISLHGCQAWPIASQDRATNKGINLLVIGLVSCQLLWAC